MDWIEWEFQEQSESRSRNSNVTQLNRDFNGSKHGFETTDKNTNKNKPERISISQNNREF